MVIPRPTIVGFFTYLILSLLHLDRVAFAVAVFAALAFVSNNGRALLMLVVVGLNDADSGDAFTFVIGANLLNDLLLLICLQKKTSF